MNKRSILFSSRFVFCELKQTFLLASGRKIIKPLLSEKGFYVLENFIQIPKPLMRVRLRVRSRLRVLIMLIVSIKFIKA